MLLVAPALVLSRIILFQPYKSHCCSRPELYRKIITVLTLTSKPIHCCSDLEHQGPPPPFYPDELCRDRQVKSNYIIIPDLLSIVYMYSNRWKQLKIIQQKKATPVSSAFSGSPLLFVLRHWSVAVLPPPVS